MLLRAHAVRRWGPRAAAGVLLATGALVFGCAQIAGLSDHRAYPVIQITAGSDHACLLVRTGEVWCWGDNTYGQLGHRPAEGGECTHACPAAPVAGISGAVQVSAGTGFTCAVTGSGDVQCWGRNDTQQLGRMTNTVCPVMTTMTACDSSPASVTGVSGAAQVSAGGGFACARSRDGKLFCWGDNAYGQLGTGNLDAPKATTPIKGLGKVVDVAAAIVGSNTCAATDAGAVFCWGYNANGGTGHTPGTLGDTMSTDAKQCTPKPVQVPGVKDAVAVRTGSVAGCAGTAAGAWRCWGYDGLGALGTMTTGTAIAPSGVTVLPAIAGFDLRGTHACAIDAAGEAWCWGQSGLGALGPEKAGIGKPCDQMVPCQHAAQDVGLGDVSQIAAGVLTGVALRTDGTVWAWGINDKGQLGHPPQTGGDTPCPANTMANCNAAPSHVEGPPPP